MNTSATGGYLQPTNTPPIYDDELDRFFHDVYMNILNFDPKLIRPRWATEPAEMPSINTNWVAHGFENFIYDDFPSKDFIDGIGLVENYYEEFDSSVSVYGPNMSSIANQLRSGLLIEQNRDVLSTNSIALINVGKIKNVSILINNRWQKKIDFTIRCRRQITMIYPILSLLEAHANIETDGGLSINVDTQS